MKNFTNIEFSINTDRKPLRRFLSIILGIVALTLVDASFVDFAVAQNPVMRGIGLCDPHVRIFNDTAFLYATHDASPNNQDFVMNDWWVWSSTDLINWNLRSILKPEKTYFGKASTECWATDAISRNGKYYMYFSMGVTNVGVVSSNTPVGPWVDPLGAPLLPEILTPVEERDPGILLDENGQAYIVAGVWDFYIARLNEDMVSLAEEPRKIVLDKKYGPYGEGRTDDKPYLHRWKDHYYLSWGCYYAMSDNVYGPYSYKGSIIVENRTAPEFQKALTYDRHGSFFGFHNQWYFMCNDQSFEGSHAYFRNSVICYVHFKNTGEIEPVYLDSTGVGRYDIEKSTVIEAENYFAASDYSVEEIENGEYIVANLNNESWLIYPNIHLNKPVNRIGFKLASANPLGGTIEIHFNQPDGMLAGSLNFASTGSWSQYQNQFCNLTINAETFHLCLVFKGNQNELIRLDKIIVE